MRFTVAIDGPAAAGKGTIARAVAEHFAFEHLDTGLLYRVIGLKALEAGGGVIDPVMAERIAGQLDVADLKRDDLRSPKAGQAASKVAVLPGVRRALLEFQRVFSRRDGGAVLDGRDIGTVICPEAEVKLFINASDDVRATRRFEELSDKGHDTTYDRVLAELRSRDARDQERTDAPLKAANDAVLLDTTELSIDAAVAQAVSIVENRLGRG